MEDLLGFEDGDAPLVFSSEERESEQDLSEKKLWKVIIVDDEPEVHTATKLVLDDFTFEGAGLECISAYTAKEAIDLIKIHEDAAVILLDVVMESDHAGLELVKIIREELNNHMIRIVLRTGQPGQAPERSVIMDYDINDYKQKTDLTSQKLFTTIYTAIRSYRDIFAIEKNRTGLRYIVEASGGLFKETSIMRLAQGVLTQVSALFKNQDSMYVRNEGFTTATNSEGDYELIAATGKYSQEDGFNGKMPLDPEIKDYFKQVVSEKRSKAFGDNFVGYFPTQQSNHHLLYLEGCVGDMSDEYRHLLEIFTKNVGIAFDNRYLNQEIQDTQQEIILLLGELVENRSKETAYHVLRVAEFINLIGQAAGYDPKEVALIKAASPMHDVGKIAIPDAILLKPGRLTPEEFTVMKKHAEIGYKILSTSKRRLLNMAGTIAYTHHERWDGTGYPRGLKGVQIPLCGRLTCIADILDALASHRVYKPAWPIEKVYDYLIEERGRIFDPHLVEAAFKAKDQIIEVREKYADELAHVSDPREYG